MKKILILAISLGLFLFFGSTVEAKPAWVSEVKQERKEIRSEIRNEISGLREQILEKLKKNFPFLLPAGINKAEITAISGTSLPAEIKVAKEGKTITLRITDKTIILRKFGGKSSLSELHFGDIVSARGTWQDSSGAVLDTRVLRDLSIQKRQGTFWGKIKSLNSEAKTFVLETATRGDQQVFVSDTTKIVSRNQTALTFMDLVIGHRVRVTGLWDLTLKTISEVKTIKDWTLSPKPTLTPTPTPI